MVVQSQFIELFGGSDYPKRPLGNLCKIHAGKTLPLDVENEGGPIAYIKVADMNLPENDRVVTTSTRNVTEETAKISGILPIGATVFPKNGAAALHNKKRITAITTCVDMNTMGVYSTSDALDPEFLYAFLVHQDVASLTLTGAIPQIRPKDIAALEIPLPPLERQREYIGMVGQADKSKFDGLKSQFIEMFGNQLEYQKSSHEKVRDYCDVVSGYPFNSELFNKDRQGSPLIRIRDVARGYTETYTTEVCDNRFEVNAGDLLVGMDGIFDIAPWASETALLNQRVCMVKPNNERVSAAFIKYAVHPVLKQIEGNTDATTVKHISAAQIADIRLPLINECKINEFTRVAQRADKSKYLS